MKAYGQSEAGSVSDSIIKTLDNSLQPQARVSACIIMHYRDIEDGPLVEFMYRR